MSALHRFKQKLHDKFVRIVETGIRNVQYQNKIREEETDIASKLLLAETLILTKFADVSKINTIKDAEFKVFSQFGQDGILQYLIKVIDIPNKTFIEFGVQTYHESTTRFLLLFNKWRGLIMDGNEEYINQIQSDPIYWASDLTAKHKFITKENINEAIADFTDEKDIGILVVDIDGNDYWVWEAIDRITPRIVVCEYNNIFGPEKSVTIPYKSDFVFPNTLYLGASLRSLVELADKKGYDFIGCNSTGNDAFFVRKDVMKSPVKKVTVQEGFEYTTFRGNRYTHKERRLTKIQDELLHDFDTGKERTIKEIYGFED